jgi:SAM-dependent methyltransferase
MAHRQHWDAVYRRRGAHDLSWFQPQAETSLRLIQGTGVAAREPLIDVGGGASTLVDGLLRAGHSQLTVLDLSAEALAVARARLGAAAAGVRWVVADVTQAALPPAGFALWHDRAVFHFLTAAEDRARYRQAVRDAVRPGGHVVIATFAEDGPPACSDLPVMRYDSRALCAELGPGFTLRHSERQVHTTPTGAAQNFTWCVLQRSADAPVTGPGTDPSVSRQAPPR